MNLRLLLPHQTTLEKFEHRLKAMTLAQLQLNKFPLFVLKPITKLKT